MNYRAKRLCTCEITLIYYFMVILHILPACSHEYFAGVSISNVNKSVLCIEFLVGCINYWSINVYIDKEKKRKERELMVFRRRLLWMLYGFFSLFFFFREMYE